MKLAAVLMPALVWTGVARADDGAPAVRAMLSDPAQLAAWLQARDPLVESARARTEAAAEQGQQARVLPNPQLQAGVGGIALGQANEYQPPGAPVMTGPTGFSQTYNL